MIELLVPLPTASRRLGQPIYVRIRPVDGLPADALEVGAQISRSPGALQPTVLSFLLKAISAAIIAPPWTESELLLLGEDFVVLALVVLKFSQTPGAPEGTLTASWPNSN